MSTTTTEHDAPANDAPAAEEMTPEQMREKIAALEAELATRPLRPVRKLTATDWRIRVDLALIVRAGELMADVPEEFRAEVAQLVANQLHHLSTAERGWPTELLPLPKRSDWR